ncbi:MAG: dihydrodipicolinate synthase family protein [Clostridia bacterium]
MSINFMVPAVTAFDEKGQVDVQANINIYEHLIKGGVDGVVILGSAGEFFSMTTEQKKLLIDTASETIQDRTRFIVGTGSMIVEEVIELSNYALQKGAEAVMIIPPYYFSYDEESILNFYEMVAPKVQGNIFIYNFPDRTGYDIPASTILKLARKHNNVTGCKDTVAVMGHTRELIETIKGEFPNFEVYAGFDENFFHNMLSGGYGNISALGNMAPEVTSGLVRAMKERDIDAIEKAQVQINELMAIYGVHDSFISTIKHAMVLRGVQMKPYCLAPTMCLNAEKDAKVKEILKASGLL